MDEIRCGHCSRLLAKAGLFDQIQIKCPRCGTMNIFNNQQKAGSLVKAPSSANTKEVIPNEITPYCSVGGRQAPAG